MTARECRRNARRREEVARLQSACRALALACAISWALLAVCVLRLQAFFY